MIGNQYFSWNRMKKKSKKPIIFVVLFALFMSIFPTNLLFAQASNSTFENPVIWADVPDPSVIRVGNTYYMSSTTMHMNPGVPIMKSHDLINWEIVNYVYDYLETNDEQALRNGKSEYGNGSWASSLKYHNGTFYLGVFSHSAGKTYIFQTDDIENGEWTKSTIDGAYHDLSLLFDDDGRVYMVHGTNNIRVTELTSDATAIKEGGLNKVIISNASQIAGSSFIVPAEGAHVQKIDGKYYIFLITWPQGKNRTQLVYRADSIDGEYEGRIALDDSGIAQGGIVDTVNGDWYGFLFQDRGAVGRVPFLVPVSWEDEWPIFGEDGKVPTEMAIPIGSSIHKNAIVASDEFYQAPKKSEEMTIFSASSYAGTDLIENGDMENGQDPWSGNGAATVQITDEEAYSGTFSLFTTGRAATGDGPRQMITGKVSPNEEFTFSAKVKYTEGPDEKIFNIAIQNGPSWQGISVMGSATIKKGEWGTIKGTYTIPENADLSQTFIFIETPWVADPDPVLDLLDFYVDDISFVNNTEVDELLENGGIEDGKEPWTGNGAATVHVTDEEAYSGSYSLLTTGRAATGDGPKQVITGKVKVGEEYKFSAKVKYTEGPNQKRFNFAIQNGPTWQGISVIGTAMLTKGEWGTIEGTYTLPLNIDTSETFIFIETPWVANPDSVIDLMDFYVDDVSFAKLPSTPEKEKDGEYDDNGSRLPLVWQWNHNPDNNFWSLTERTGYLRLTTGRTSTSILDARNTLTQRTFGPESSGRIAMEIGNMRDGDVAGLAAFQRDYGFVGVKAEGNQKSIVMVDGSSESPTVIESIPVTQDRVYFKVDFDFKDRTDKAYFYYSLNGIEWTAIGNTLQMRYTIPHFMGYRFALFNYTTKNPGGYVDFDYFRIDDKITGTDTSETVLKISLDDVPEVIGAPNIEFEVPVRMDPLPNGEYSSLTASFSIPKKFNVTGVDFHSSNIVGNSSYTYSNNQLKLNVVGDTVGFTHEDSDLFATIKLTVKDFATSNKTEVIKTDYVKVSGGNIDFDVHGANATIGLQKIETEALGKIPGYSNPLITHKLGADPNVLVHNDRVYMFMTNDEFQYGENGNIIQNNYSYINTITVISSEDLINWTDHGAIPVAGPNGPATWASQSWAVTVTEKVIDGKEKFFLYFSNNASGVGVLTADHPLGPWTDPRGSAIVDRNTPGGEDVVWVFDPAVFVDDDGQGYLYYGGGVPGGNNPTEDQQRNPKTARVVKLSDDMINIEGRAEAIDAPFMFEASEMHKYKDKYYFSYSTNFSSASRSQDMPGSGEIAYMISDNPMGPFTYVGTVLKNPYQYFEVGGNNHHEFFEFKGQWYVAYHAQTVAKELNVVQGYRSPHLNKIEYFNNGNMKEVKLDMEGVPPVATLNPYERTEAETIAWNAGISTEVSNAPGSILEQVNLHVTDIENGDWVAVSQVDFGEKGAKTFQANVASTVGGTIELRVDSPVGEVIGTLDIEPTGGVQQWKVLETSVSNVKGIRNIFFMFSGEEGDTNLFNFDYWMFTEGAGDPGDGDGDGGPGDGDGDGGPGDGDGDGGPGDGDGDGGPGDGDGDGGPGDGDGDGGPGDGDGDGGPGDGDGDGGPGDGDGDGGPGDGDGDGGPGDGDGDGAPIDGDRTPKDDSKDRPSNDRTGDSKPDGKGGIKLPSTATNMYNYLFAGIVLLFIGALIVYQYKRRKEM
ncbi:family 43 glycosylhydrolase [Bacillus alkalicellulosilyticus]|uniref:family 43 glycosylhydrolase n=1 Tax=Alkalihalobacterium alkalicellulosilyticum TaxID=1912214 RepID=UPI001FEB4432|nr:family 43 glycosylhydrolase [Bacillus alkalicellulosilyticus]